MLRTRFCERFGIEAPIAVAPMGPSLLARMGITDAQTESQIWDRLIPMSRRGTAEEVAAAAVSVWICSDAASFVTGQAMLLDGGLTAQ